MHNIVYACAHSHLCLYLLFIYVPFIKIYTFFLPSILFQNFHFNISTNSSLNVFALQFHSCQLNKRISVNPHTNHSISYLLLISLSFMHAPTFHLCLYHLLMLMSCVPFIHAHIISGHFHTCINISFIFKQGTCMYFTL